MQAKQPKITQKLLLRSALGLFALAGLVLAFVWYKGRESDPNGGKTIKSEGWVAAIEAGEDTNHVVVFKNDGTKVEQPNIPANSDDQDIAWRPDGNALFFASNREKGKYTMFRWIPDGSTPEMRSPGGLVQGAPFFLNSDADLGVDAIGLITGGGRVLAYDPKTPTLRQVLPPPDPKARVATNPDGATSSPFEGVYERFGTSIRVAKWTPDKKGVLAVMRRETGEILIYQKLDFTTAEEGQPRAVVAGDRVDFDIDQHTGRVYYTVENFQFVDPANPPVEYLKNGKAIPPYKHALGVLDLTMNPPLATITKSNDDKSCFGSLAVDPAGEKLAVVHGSYSGGGNLLPDSMLVAGFAGDIKGKIGKLVQGEVYEPNWSPDGKKLAFARRESPTSRPIYIIDEASSAPRRLTPEKGIYSFPVFSPQLASSK